jgi:ankyrin repeat protein
VPEPLTDAELAFLTSLFDAARDGDTDALLAAVDAGVPVNLTNSSGDSLLILASYHVQAPAVTGLLERGADTERVNDRGQTALGAATFRRSAEIVTALLDAGANPHGGGRTAVEVATFFELPDMLALLVSDPGPVA